MLIFWQEWQSGNRNWEFSEWNKEDDVLLMKWHNLKSDTAVTLSYSPDIDWELDVIYYIASYLVTSGRCADGAGDENWLFSLIPN